MNFFKKSSRVQPRSIRATQHRIPADLIPRHALQVVSTLQEKGFQAYLVGGCVRDLILGLSPKDFDVATNATPNEIRKIFRNCRLIGRRFVLAHIYFGKSIIEVATFRGNPKPNLYQKLLNKIADRDQTNCFGPIEEDALRRDFTINALYYDPVQATVLDYTAGFKDLCERNICLIGDPATRFKEDPVRLLRAVRFASKINFDITPDTAAPMRDLAHLLSTIPAARLFDEVLKLFLYGHAKAVLPYLRQYDLMTVLFPDTPHYLQEDWDLIEQGLHNTDVRIAANKPCSASFLLAFLLWPAFLFHLDQADNPQGYTERQAAMKKAIANTGKRFSIPKKISALIIPIWTLQFPMASPRRSQVKRLRSHPQFRPALDLLELRAQTDSPELQGCVERWKIPVSHEEA